MNARRLLLHAALCAGLIGLLQISRSQEQQPPTPADGSTLPLPNGTNVAIVVFEDVQSPDCARAHPGLLAAAARNKVPLVILTHFPGHAVPVVDTLGAGDVWHGAFSLGLAEHMAPPDAVRFASAAAALKVQRAGGRAGAPGRAEVDDLLRQAESPAARTPA